MSPLEMAMASRLLSAAQPSCSNDLNDLMGGAGGWSQKKLRKTHGETIWGNQLRIDFDIIKPGGTWHVYWFIQPGPIYKRK